MSVLVGEVWVAMRPQMTSFGSDVKKELEKVLNPSGQAGLGGLMNKVGALTAVALASAVAVSAKWAIDLEKSQAALQGTMGITAQAAGKIGKGFLDTAGQSTYSAQEMMAAFGPLGGQLKIINNGALDVAQSVGYMKTAGQLADATNQQLAGDTANLTGVLQTFQMKLKDAGAAANILYTTSTSTGTSLDTLSRTLIQLHMKLGQLDPSLKGVGSLMVDLASHGTYGARGVRAIASGLEHLVNVSAKAPFELRKAVDAATTTYTNSVAAVQKAREHLAQKQVEINFAGGASTPSQVFALQNAQQAVTDALKKQSEAYAKLQAAKSGDQLTSASAAATLAQLHISLYNNNHQFIGMRALITELQPKLAKLKGAQLELALSNLFGAGSAQQFYKIIQAGPAAYDKAQAAVTRHNAVINAARAYQATLAGQMRELGATLKDLGTDFGIMILPALHFFAETLAHVTEFLMHNKAAAIALGVVLGTILGAAMLHYVGSVSVKFGKAIAGDIQGLLRLTNVSKTAADTQVASNDKVVSSTGAYVDAKGRAHDADGKFIKMTPELQAALDEQAAAVNTVTDATQRLADTAPAAAAGLDEVGAAAAGTTGEMDAAALSTEGTGVAAETAAPGFSILGLAMDALPILGLIAATTLLATHWKLAWSIIKDAALVVWHFLDNDVIHPIEHGIKWVVSEIKSHWELLAAIFLAPFAPFLVIIGLIAKFHTQIIGFFERLPGEIAGFFTRLPGEVVGFIDKAFTVLLGIGSWLLTNVVQPVIACFVALPGDVANAIGDFFSVAFAAMLNAGAWIVNHVIALVVFEYVTLPRLVANALGDFFTAAFHAMLSVGTWLLTHVIGPTVSFFAALPGRVASAIGEFFSVAWHAMLAAGAWVDEHVIFPVVKFFLALPGRVANALGNFISTAFHIFTEIPKWIWDHVVMPIVHFFEDLPGHIAHGIASGASHIVDAVGHVASDVMGAISTGFGLFSPSRKFREVGQKLMDGLQLGITEHKGKALVAIDGLVVETLKKAEPLVAAFATSTSANLGKVITCFEEFGAAAHAAFYGVPDMLDSITVASSRTAAALGPLHSANVLGGPAGEASSSHATQAQMLVVMRELVNEERRNTQALRELTDEEKKPIKATIRKTHGGHHGGGDQLALILAR